MADVYLAYAREDELFARCVAEALSTKWTVFFDQSIQPGNPWHRRLESELDHSQAVVVLWSKFSVAKDWVLDEASRGKDRGILIPVRIDDCRLPLGFGVVETQDLISWDGSLEDAAWQRLDNSVLEAVFGNGLGQLPN